jgi:PAT family beta-lactamase induction signal transducer AmpG
MKQYFNKRILATLVLGFYSGLPIAMTGTTLQAWFASKQMSVVSIGMLTLVGVPYLYKFLWAPFIDRFNILSFLPIKKFKAWMVVCQLVISLCLFCLAFLDPRHTVTAIVLLVFTVAFFSATQDSVIDAFRTELLEPDERGFGSACFVFSYRIAVLVSGGLGLILAGYIGWHGFFLALAALMFVSVFATFTITDVKERTKPHFTMKAYLIEPIRSFLKRDAGLMLLVFILTYKFGDAFAQALLTAFFIQHLHFTLIELGSLYKVVGLLSAVLGAFLGGLLLPKFGMYRMLLYFGFVQAIANLYFLVLTMGGHSYSFAVSAVMFENITSGITSTVFVAFMMSLCDLRFTATQYALMTALSAVGRVIVGPVAGVVVAYWGWQVFFVLSFLVVLPSLYLLMVLRRRVDIDDYSVSLSSS